MKKLASGIVASFLAGSMLFAAAVPVSAQSFSLSFGTQDRYIGDYCDRNSRDRDCREWRRDRRDWDRDDYTRWYHRHPGGGDVAAGIFGFALGAMIGSGLNNDDDRRSNRRMSASHVDRCEDEYRSYDVRTDTFLGYDGDRHYCNL